MRLKSGADLGQLHVDYVAEFALRIVGDAYLRDSVRAEADVLVLRRVEKVAGNDSHD